MIVKNIPTSLPEQILKVRNQSVQYKLRDKTRQFIDFMRITINGGRGGDGCISFHREKYVDKGPPDGGNGGRGGNVIFVASSNHSSLHTVPKNIKGGSGGPGKGRLRHGLSGKDVMINIPLGTIVKEVDPPQRKLSSNDDDDDNNIINEDDKKLDEEASLARKRADIWVHYPRYETQNPLGSFFLEAEKLLQSESRKKKKLNDKLYLDVSTPNVQHVVAQGGSGGKGNPHFLTSANRSPKFATRGQRGQVKYLELELKTIADAGLVGLPNAGKSTFLTAVSNAHPKIAAYPFTTLNPYIGTVDYNDKFQLTIADIPGLIRGAHKNIGLGHSFLRHVERSKVLVYVIDLSGESPWNDLTILQNELELYNSVLTKRPSLIIANKADVTEVAKKNLPILESKVKEIEKQLDQQFIVVPISAKYRKNIHKVTSLLRSTVEDFKNNESDVTA
ncbi:17384_t:CDS:2 [Entrophospora sp. SA101]|nr:5367_t:CDS:2 [Entrophospora sp. SA101]CAJ0637695.1 14778_t:CDS:2 [Entrophospora sp. SA101]CAJ0749108.1 22607_t:CDS:2 [Entrophospora sp. SA101]CAJ0756553.1 21856_t:CDS:2 [Entrophospora sp. SA101]CAJ0757895.1 17384_t:CDS:2 [Entrophospora sp. SA101]